ncbi:unnamed protein product, partial [Tilletia laevis]
MNAISTDSSAPPGHVVQVPAKSQRTASIFRRPKTADTERRLFSQPQPKIPANAAPRESASGSQTTDPPRSSLREGRRLLASKSASSTALKYQYKEQDANAPVPVMLHQQSSYIPQSPRNSSSSKRRDVVPTSGLD